MEDNIQCLDTVRAYGESIPTFLHRRPRRFVQHCMKRLPPSVDSIPTSSIEHAGHGVYVVHRKHTHSTALHATDQFRHVSALTGSVTSCPVSICLLFVYSDADDNQSQAHDDADANHIDDDTVQHMFQVSVRTCFGNSLDKLRHTASVVYSGELDLLNKHQISYMWTKIIIRST